MPIIVTSGGGPVADTESLVLHGLELNDGTTYGLTNLQLPIPRKKPEWVEGADADGALLMRDPLVSNGQLVARIDIMAADRDATHVLMRDVIQRLEEAERSPGGVECVWTPAGGTESLTFYVLTGEITEHPPLDGFGDHKWLTASVASITVTMDCRPGGYGERALYGTTTSGVTGPQVTVTVEDFPGDMPSDKAELIVTDTSSQSRRWVEWGAEYYHYDDASPSTLVLDSDSLVTSGYSGTQTTLAGSYDPGASGNSIVTATVVNAWQAIAGTGAQPHIGTFRVKARVNSGPSGCNAQFRLAWRTGDGAYETNTPYVLTTGVQAFHEIDLGEIVVPPATGGTQSWDGRVDATSTTGGDTLYLDYIRLEPTSAGYGRARATGSTQTGVIVARDDFTGTTSGVALNARAAPAGGSWATSGVATDFAFVDVTATYGTAIEAASRSTNTTEATPRYAILGSSNFSSAAVQSDIYADGAVYALGDARFGLVARWVDSSNHLRAYVKDVFGTETLVIEEVIAGTATTLASTSASAFSQLTTFTLRLEVGDGGTATLYLRSSSGSTVASTSAYSANLVTGGTLDDGKPGLLDQIATGGATVARYYDNFYVEQLPASPLAIYSGRTLEVRSATTERQSSDGTTYGRPGSYRGSRFVLNPAGVESRVTRVAVSAFRNDVDAGGTAEHISDGIKLDVYARPHYSVVP
jgi:hypothetical protein